MRTVHSIICISAVAALSLSMGRNPGVPAGDRALLVTDAAELGALSAAGAALGRQLGDLSPDLTSQGLLRQPAYRSLVSDLREALQEERRLVEAAPDGAGRYASLLRFDWLLSPEARFELIAAVSRPDRRTGECGELRLIYRLAYALVERGEAVDTRLPMAVALVYPLVRPHGERDCRGLYTLTVADLVRRLPPAPSFRTLELNAQVSRLPAFAGSEFAEQTRYLLRVYDRSPQDGRLQRRGLENTPDVDALMAEPAARAALLAYLSSPAALAAAARGELQLPGTWLARSTVSVAPFGLDRLVNRPFSQLFAAADFAGVDLSAAAPYDDPERLLRRLDSLSCAGCHQSRSVAGFHVLGEARAPGVAFNASRLPLSPYLEDLLAWRRLYLEAVMTARPDRPALPSTERGARNYGGYGARCGESAGPFAAWGCDAGLGCRLDLPATGSGVGQCLPPGPGDGGDPCEALELHGTVSGWTDRLDGGARTGCRQGSVCSLRTAGFPGGGCSTACKDRLPEGLCVRAPILGPFSECLAKGGPFRGCLDANGEDLAMRRCGPGRPCRDDYVCASRGAGDGVCMPTYFLPQLSVEHHQSAHL